MFKVPGPPGKGWRIENEGNRIRNVFDIIKSRGWEPVKQYASRLGRLKMWKQLREVDLGEANERSLSTLTNKDIFDVDR